MKRDNISNIYCYATKGKYLGEEIAVASCFCTCSQKTLNRVPQEAVQRAVGKLEVLQWPIEWLWHSRRALREDTKEREEIRSERWGAPGESYSSRGHQLNWDESIKASAITLKVYSFPSLKEKKAKKKKKLNLGQRMCWRVKNTRMNEKLVKLML